MKKEREVDCGEIKKLFDRAFINMRGVTCIFYIRN